MYCSQPYRAHPRLTDCMSINFIFIYTLSGLYYKQLKFIKSRQRYRLKILTSTTFFELYLSGVSEHFVASVLHMSSKKRNHVVVLCL